MASTPARAASNMCVNLRARQNGDDFRGRPETDILLLRAQLNILHCISRRLEGHLSIYRFMTVCKCPWISFSQITQHDFCHRTGNKLILPRLCSEELATLHSNKVFLSLLALEQGDTSSLISQVMWIIYSSSRESASYISFLLFSDNLKVFIGT